MSLKTATSPAPADRSPEASFEFPPSSCRTNEAVRRSSSNTGAIVSPFSCNAFLHMEAAYFKDKKHANPAQIGSG
jgi:hypothetical protein